MIRVVLPRAAVTQRVCHPPHLPLTIQAHDPVVVPPIGVRHVQRLSRRHHQRRPPKRLRIAYEVAAAQIVRRVLHQHQPTSVIRIRPLLPIPSRDILNPAGVRGIHEFDARGIDVAVVWVVHLHQPPVAVGLVLERPRSVDRIADARQPTEAVIAERQPAVADAGQPVGGAGDIDDPVFHIPFDGRLTACAILDEDEPTVGVIDGPPLACGGERPSARATIPGEHVVHAGGRSVTASGGREDVTPTVAPDHRDGFVAEGTFDVAAVAHAPPVAEVEAPGGGVGLASAGTTVVVERERYRRPNRVPGDQRQRR